MGETTRLTDEQREGHFHRGLALERALAKLPDLKARFLEALARTEESLHAQHTRHMAAATTGEDPEARPHQQGLFKDSPSSAPSQASKRPKPAPRKEEQPDPEPPKGATRPRPRAATEAKGTRRAETTASARTVTAAEATHMEDDAVPAPAAVPCCTCGDSLADHQDGHGACRAKKCPATPRCEAFQLGRVWDWEVRWRSGFDAAGQLTFFLYRENEERSAFSNWGPFVMQDGALTSVETGWRVLEQARKLGGRWPGGGKGDVPVRVLEFVERFLAEASPEAPTAPVSTPVSPTPKPDNGERWWALSDGLDLEVTGARTDTARVWVRTHGSRGKKACHGPFTLDAAGCLTPVAGANSVTGRWQASPEGLTACRFVAHFIEESEYARAAVAHIRPSSADTESTCDGCGNAFKASQLQPVGPEGARGFYCASCRAEQEAQDEKPEPPAAPSARPEASAPAASSAQPELGGMAESEPGVPIDSVNQEEVEDLRQVLRLLKGAKGSGPVGARLRRVVSVLATAAREESWSHLAGHEPWRVVLHPHAKRGEVWLSHGTRALGTVGPWRWDGERLTRAADWDCPHPWPVKRTVAELALAKLEPALRAALATPEEPAQENTGGTWCVELPERLEGRRRIVPVWLVNAALGERRAASWWGTDSGGLKPSHHLSGELRGAALDEHAELRTWWVAHAETVVKPLEQACRDGAVPGLRVGVPTEPLADGPFFYALSGGWRLEVWDFADEEVHFTKADGRRHGPFRWDDGAGCLVTSASVVLSWSNQHEALVREADDFITRGFIHELRAGGAS